MTHIGPDFQLRQTAIQSLLPVLLVLMSTSGSTLAVEPLLMRRDMQALLSPRVLMWAGAGVAAGALVHPWDNEVRFGLQEQPRLRDMLDVVDVYGSNRYASSGLVVTWGAARLIGHQPAAALSSGLVRSVVLANVLVTPLKFTVGRERPDGSNNRSFPSGHSANAFALPGGYISVYTGLIEKSASYEELASVLAHEIAHVTMRHGVTRMVESVGVIAVLQLIFGDVGGLVGLAEELFTIAAINGYSRGHESEADEEGVRMMHAAGIDPSAAANFFRMLKESEPGSDMPDVLAWVSTHPEHDERIAAIEAQVVHPIATAIVKATTVIVEAAPGTGR